MIFDETYVHTAENRTPTTRIILLCDIERPLKNRRRALDQSLRSATGSCAPGPSPNQVGDKQGILSTLAQYCPRGCRATAGA